MKLFFVLILCCLFGYPAVNRAQEAAQWRGANRDGRFSGQNLLENWPAEGPRLLWAFSEAGEGYGSVAVTTDRLFLNGRIDSVSYLLAIGLDGNLLWKSPNGPEFSGREYAANFPGSRSTPTLVENQVYACSGNGRVACYDQNTGAENWSVEMVSDLGGRPDQHGYCESLLVDDSLVYCLPGGMQNNVVALNRFSGRMVWSSKALSDSATYCSPSLIDLPGQKIFMTFSGHHLLGLDGLSGELLWWHEQAYHRYHQHCNTPLYADGAIYYISGEGNGAVKLNLSPDGRHISEEWRTNRVNNVYHGFLLDQGRVFVPDKTQKLKCIDSQSGLVTDSLRVNRGALIGAGEMMICYSESGDVNLIQHDGSHMELAGKFKIDQGSKEHFAHPVVAGGILYVRHGTTLLAYTISKN